MATDFEAALRADVERLNKAAQPVMEAMTRAYVAANIALLEEWAKMLFPRPAQAPSPEELSARLAYHAEKARLEREAWAEYQWRNAHPWRARMRRLRRLGR
jgi:hypothetical protein